MGYQRPEIQKMGFLKVFVKPSFTVEQEKNTRMDWRVERLKGFIDGQDGKMGSDLRQVCQQLELGITAAYAGKLFAHDMDIGLREYAMQQRFGKAAEKLKSSSCSVKEIAADSGYRSPRDFSRGFKRVFHLSPMEYRRAYHLTKGMSSVMIRSDSPSKGRDCRGSANEQLGEAVKLVLGTKVRP